MMEEWGAWHVFIADRSSSDRFLVDAIESEIAPLCAEHAISNWFFIHYWENGPHIRLRVRNLDRSRFLELGTRLRAIAQSTIASVNEPPERYSDGMRFDGWHTNPAALPLFDQGSVVEIMYEPEYRRYGGATGLELNEALFRLSSRTALKVISSTLDDWVKRESIALHLTAATMMAFVRDRDGLIDFLAAMAAGWRSFAPEPEVAEATARETYKKSSGMMVDLFARIASADLEGWNCPSLIKTFGEKMSKGCGQLAALSQQGRLISPLTGIPPRNEEELDAALKSFMMSQIHMSNNRLGFSPLHEYRFAQMLLWASGDRGSA